MMESGTSGSLLTALVPRDPSEGPSESFARASREAVRQAVDLLEAMLDAPDAPTVEGVLEPYNRAVARLEDAIRTAYVVSSVHPDPAVRDTAEACAREPLAVWENLMRDPRFFARLAAIDTTAVDPATRYLVEKLVRECVREGADRDAATRLRLAEIDAELLELGQAYERNLAEDVRSIGIADPARLRGLPADYLAARPPDAAGLVTITTRAPDYVPFMTYCDDADLRRELYVAARSRAYPANEPVLGRILSLRHAKATRLGFPSWAAYVTQETMAGTPEVVDAFLDDVGRSIRSRAEADYQALLEHKRVHVDPAATVVEEHDVAWLKQRVRAERHAFDPQAVRPYLPYAGTEQGVIDLTAEMYGLSYVPVVDAALWHPDVKAFELCQDGKLMARIYLDMHPREGKYQHIMFVHLRSGIEGVQVPEAILVCNFPNPRDDGAGLLEPGQVRSLFHEFGHLMHHVVAGRHRWVEQSGIRTEEDFTEVPSKLFEEWGRAHESLARFAHHVQTGEPIPPALVEKLNDADRFGKGLELAESVFLAVLALRLHTVGPEDLDIGGLVRATQAELKPFPHVDGTHLHANFSHLINYSARYYTYLWSETIVRDLFGAFRAEGLLSTACHRRYRDMVLAPGGSKPAAELIRDFLGRPFGLEAFRAWIEAE